MKLESLTAEQPEQGQARQSVKERKDAGESFAAELSNQAEVKAPAQLVAKTPLVDMSTQAVAPKPGKPAKGLNALPERPENFVLRSAHVTTGDEDAVSVKQKAKDEKKRVSSSEEVMLVARALAPSARSIPLIDTKKPEQKAERAAVGAEQISTRAKGMTEHTRIGAHADGPKKKAEAVKEATPEAKKQLELEAKKEGQAPAPAGQQLETFKLEQPQLVKDAAPLAQVAPMMLEDPSVRAVLMPHVARMSLDTGDGERLELQLKIKDGVTDVQAAGPAAAMMQERQGEIRVALAKEGLALGHFDLTQHGSQQQKQHSTDRRDAAEESAPSFARRAAIASSTASISNTVTSDGRVHVKA